MSISLDQLLSEADELIEKNASLNKNERFDDEDDIFKLAQKLTSNELEVIEETPFEKIAHAMAIIETVQSINNAKSVEKFEKMARENGYSEEEVGSFLESKGIVPLHKMLTIPEEFLC